MMNGLKFGNPYFSICVLHNLTQLKLLHQIDWGEVRLTRIKSDIDLTCDRKRQASAIPLHIRFSFVMHYSFVLLSCLVTQIGWKLSQLSMKRHTEQRISLVQSYKERTYKKCIIIFVMYFPFLFRKNTPNTSASLIFMFAFPFSTSGKIPLIFLGVSALVLQDM